MRNILKDLEEGNHSHYVLHEIKSIFNKNNPP